MRRPLRWLAALAMLAASGLWAGCAVMAAVVTGPDETAMLLGSLVQEDPVWDRLSAECDGDPFFANHFYDIHTVRNDGAEDLLLTLTATWTGGDGFLFVFDEMINVPFRLGCIVGNDDKVEGDFSQSEIVDERITAGETLYVVATTFQGGLAIGDYDIVVATAPAPALPPTL